MLKKNFLKNFDRILGFVDRPTGPADQQILECREMLAIFGGKVRIDKRPNTAVYYFLINMGCSSIFGKKSVIRIELDRKVSTS